MVNNKALYFYKNKLNSKLGDLYRGGVIDDITYKELMSLVDSEDSIEVLANSLDISMYTDAILYMQKINLLVSRCIGNLGGGSEGEEEEIDSDDSEDGDSFFSDDGYTELDDDTDENGIATSSYADYDEELDDSFFSELDDYEDEGNDIESLEDSFFSDDEDSLDDSEELGDSEDSFFIDTDNLDDYEEEAIDSEDSFFIDDGDYSLEDYEESEEDGEDSEDDFFVDDEEYSLEDYEESEEDGEDGFFVDDTDYIGEDSGTSNTNSSTVNNIIGDTTDTTKLASTTSSYDGKSKLFRDREHGSGQDILDSIALASKVGKRCVMYLGKFIKTD